MGRGDATPSREEVMFMNSTLAMHRIFAYLAIAKYYLC